jgi:glycerol-3-phosphate O-acyltransferase
VSASADDPLPTETTRALAVRSAMVARPTRFLERIGRWMFDQVELDETALGQVRTACQDGPVVYVMRNRSLLDYLFFNRIFIRHQLPLAAFANGLDTRVFSDFSEWFGERWASLFGRARPEPPASEQLERALREGHSVLLFLRSRSMGAARTSAPSLINKLVELQRSGEVSVRLLPQLIVWPRKPPSRRRSWFDILFGDQEAPGRLRKVGHFVRHRKTASVRFGEPVDLARFLEEQADGLDDARLARKLRGLLSTHLSREALSVHGPRVKPAATIRREVLGARSLREELEKAAKEEGVTLQEAMANAARDIEEISAETNFDVLLAWGMALDVVFNRIYDGVEVDLDGMRKVREAARNSRRAPLVLVPSHKSHIDYLVISWVFLRNGFIPPHIAAGVNLAFFPIGALLRRGGAFFLRRSFKGQFVYGAVFRAYLWKLLREGYPVEFFPEGGRSRTGKLLPPKLGMLGMLMDGIRRGELKDLQFVPININYERIVEQGAYKKELTGGEKETESAAGLVKAGRVLRHRYGRVYVSFEEPVRLSDYLAARGIDDPVGLEEDALRSVTRRLGYSLMRKILEATVVTPTGLAATVLLSHERRGISEKRLLGRIGFLATFLTRRGARLSNTIQAALNRQAAEIASSEASSDAEGHLARGHALRAVIAEAIELLVRAKLVERTERDGEMLLSVPEEARIELDHYRNNVLGLIAPDALIATAIRAGEPTDTEHLAAEVRRLSYWFRLEFIYEVGINYQANFNETFARMQDDGLVDVDEDGRVLPSAPRILDFLRGTVLHLVEGYWIAADALRAFGQGALTDKDWVRHAREHGEREYLEGDIRRAEAVSTALLKNALQLFLLEGLVTKTPGRGRKQPAVYRLAEDTELTDVAFRRDDIGLYLTRRDEAPPRPATPVKRTDEAEAVEPEPVDPAAPHAVLEEGAPAESDRPIEEA